MLIRLSNLGFRFGAACGLTALLAGGGALAGEKIRFSDEPEKNRPPGQGMPNDFSRPFELRPSAPSAAEGAHLPPPPPTKDTKNRDPKVEEWIDQKKNWIFSTPSRGDSDAALKKTFNVREYRFEEAGGEKRSKSAIDRYFDREGDTRRESANKLNSKNRDAEELDPSERQTDSLNIGGLPLEQNSKSSTSAMTDLVPSGLNRKSSELGSPMSAAPGDILPRNFNTSDVFGFPRRQSGGGLGSLSSSEQRLQDFKKMLGGSPAGAGLSRDSINLQRDGTRQIINPIAGGAGSGLSGGLDTGLAGAGAGVSPLGAGRSSISDGIRFNAAGSSFSPSVGLPAPSGFVQPRPAILEIPRRKF